MNRCVYIAVLLLSMFVTGCLEEKVDEILMQQDDVSLVVRGSVILHYDGNTCQMAYNAKKSEYRVMDDGMAHYFILKCDSDLSDLEQVLTAELRYTTLTDIKVEKGLTFSIVKVEPSTGKFWLWCQSRKIGIVVRKI